MEGELGTTLLLHNVRGTLADRVLLVGLGKEREFREREFRAAHAAAVKLLNETGSSEARSASPRMTVKRREIGWRVEHAVVASMEGVYRFDQMKSKPPEVRAPLRKLTLSVPQRNEIAAGEKPRSSAAWRSPTAWSSPRTSATCRGNVCTPTYLAEQARELGKRHEHQGRGARARRRCEKLGMGCVPRGRAAAARSRPSSSCCEYHGAQARSRSRSCWSARASPSTPAASRSSPPARWTR